MMIGHGWLPCDTGCEFVTPTGTMHNLLGMVGFTAAIGGIWRLTRQAMPGTYRAFSTAAVAIAAVGFMLWIAIAKAGEVAAANGSLQRVFVGALLMWMFVTSVRQLRSEAR
jgi:hypothetical protein